MTPIKKIKEDEEWNCGSCAQRVNKTPCPNCGIPGKFTVEVCQPAKEDKVKSGTSLCRLFGHKFYGAHWEAPSLTCARCGTDSRSLVQPATAKEHKTFTEDCYSHPECMDTLKTQVSSGWGRTGSGRHSNLPRSWEIMFTLLRLWKLWRGLKGYRLGQLIGNVHPEAKFYYTEDNDFIRQLESFYK